MIFGGLFDFDKKEEEIKKLEEITKESNFWDDVSLANKKITELNNLKKEINNICSLKEKINNNLEILSLLKNENDEELQKLVEEDIENIKNSLEELKLELYLNHEYDHKNCILEFMREQEEQKVVIGLRCFIECILDIVKKKDIKLLF